MLTVIAEIFVKPGRRLSVLQAIEKVTPRVLQEAGCGRYQAFTDYDAQLPWKQHSPDSIFMLEHWDSLHHLQQHQQAEHMATHRSNIKNDVVEVKIFVLEPAQ